ncbi:hypothetical protein FRB94_012732 [Tulasnella sp. JGI-2019a]|nr:hypothetical protein FRB94_012732 [Tulasnella sp. JGI-2019a]KAG9018444.1 hypothetical protein FRB93_000147 [Tulasnella sp. JGI-2019a]KAG9031828.1 hypothetical protein FRB95_002273 [Tulasnella sp. JGI-2019a]
MWSRPCTAFALFLPTAIDVLMSPLKKAQTTPVSTFRSLMHTEGDILSWYFTASINTSLRSQIDASQRLTYLAYLGRGTPGCSHNVLGGLKDKVGDLPSVVAKTPLKKGKRIPTVERKALADIAELYLAGKSGGSRLFGINVGGRDWVIMKKHTGILIFDTMTWTTMFPEGSYNRDFSDDAVRECDAFVRAKYVLMVDRWQSYIDLSTETREWRGRNDGGWDQADYNLSNFLWDEDAIWDLAQKEDIREANARKGWYDDQLYFLEYYSEIALRDVPGTPIE